MVPFSSRAVEAVFDQYPAGNIRGRMLALRDLIFDTAEKTGVGTELEETLKWGEPSYVCKSGSTLRIHWKESDLDCYRMFFHCQTSLIPTFRERFPHQFSFEGNRAICFNANDEPDLAALEKCVAASLRYHEVKNLPNLGIESE